MGAEREQHGRHSSVHEGFEFVEGSESTPAAEKRGVGWNESPSFGTLRLTLPLAFLFAGKDVPMLRRDNS